MKPGDLVKASARVQKIFRLKSQYGTVLEMKWSDHWRDYVHEVSFGGNPLKVLTCDIEEVGES
jgi:hypothetical protein